MESTFSKPIDDFLVNDLTTGGTTKALTAEMGKTLNSNINNKLKTDTATATAASFAFTGRTANDVIVNARCTNANYLIIPMYINGLHGWYGTVFDLPVTSGNYLTIATFSSSLTIEYDYYTRT